MSKANRMQTTSALSWAPPYQRADSILLDGCNYLLSKYNGKWAVLHDGQWCVLPNEDYTFVYMGREPNGRNSKWKVIRKTGTPKLKSRDEEGASADTDICVGDGLKDFKVVAHINKHVDTVHVRARDTRHAEMLTLSELSTRTHLSVATLRSMCLPDSLDIQLQPED